MGHSNTAGLPGVPTNPVDPRDDRVGMIDARRGMASPAPDDAPQARGFVGAPHAEPVPR